MKQYKIHKIRKSFMPNSSERLKEEAEKFVNEKAALGCEIVSVSFDSADSSGYIYCYITYCQ